MRCTAKIYTLLKLLSLLALLLVDKRAMNGLKAFTIILKSYPENELSNDFVN